MPSNGFVELQRSHSNQNRNHVDSEVKSERSALSPLNAYQQLSTDENVYGSINALEDVTRVIRDSIFYVLS